MRPTLTIYISRLFLQQLVVIGFGFVALLQVFDLLKNARRIMERHGDSVGNLAYYAALRLPEIVSFLLPLCILVAALMTLTRLTQHNEIVALKAAGLSIFRFLLAFLPAVVAVAAAHMILSDQVAPAAYRALQQWDAQSIAASGRARSGSQAMWVRSGQTIVRIAGVRDGGNALSGVTLFQRDGNGNLTERLVGREARHTESGWSLFDVDRTVWPENGAPQVSHLDRVAWQADVKPKDLDNVSTDPNGLSLGALVALADASGLGRHPEHYYRTWVQKRIATPVSALVMILLAASVAQTLARSHGGAVNFALGAGLGFLYLIIDGVALTLGEAGSLPPLLAAWAPIALFGCVGGAAMIYREGA
jgi:lipopolysaccharide export system permease protein